MLHVCLTHRSMVLRRRRPFLIRPLENTLVKLILSLEFYSQEGRQKIAISAFAARQKLSAPCQCLPSQVN